MNYSAYKKKFGNESNSNRGVGKYLLTGTVLLGVLATYALSGSRTAGVSAEPIKVPQKESVLYLPEITPANVNTVLKGTYIIDVWANWCRPCRKYSKPFSETAHKYRGKGINFIKMDFDENKETIEQLVRQGVLSKKIRSIPCTIVLEDGKESKRFLGGNEKKLHEIVEGLID